MLAVEGVGDATIDRFPPHIYFLQKGSLGNHLFASRTLFRPREWILFGKKAPARSWFYCFNFCNPANSILILIVSHAPVRRMRIASCSGMRVDFEQEIVSLLYPQLINQTRPICISKEGRCKLCSHAKPPISLQNHRILIVNERKRTAEPRHIRPI